MATVTDLVEETRRQLMGSHRGQMNKLASSITAGQTSFSVSFEFGGITPGSYISVDDELMYVWQIEPATMAVTVQRGMLGTTAVAHSADDLIEVDPAFPRVRIKKALKDEILSWGSQLFQVLTSTVSGSDMWNAQGIDLDIEPFYNVLAIRREPPAGVGGSWPELVHFEVARNLPFHKFPSRTALNVLEPLPNSADLEVVYSAPFDLDVFDDDTDLELDVGLTSSMFDIPPLGAAWRLDAPRTIQRNTLQVQGEPRVAEEVGAQDILQTASTFKTLRDMRVAEEAARLRAVWPHRAG